VAATGAAQRELLPVLDSLRGAQLPAGGGASAPGPRLLFLRDTEHAIQAWEDRQTQELPVDETPRLALAHSMGFADWEAFAAALGASRRRGAHISPS
jgi:glutamate-ammonia-ligase adenylyltransferase